MDPIHSIAASGLRSRLESLELLSNNLANTNTAGYKQDSEFYGLYRSQVVEQDAASADPATPSMPYIQRPWTDFAQGTIARTGNSGDLALSGPGFFSVQAPGGVLYTRNGHFNVAGDGQLKTAEGYPVLNENGDALRVAPGREFTVDAEGTVRQGTNTVGKIRLVTFKNTAAMEKRGYSYFSTQDSPETAANCTVSQGSTEDSNVPVAQSAIRLVGLTRQFEMLNRAVTVCGDMGRMAVQELGKVNG